MATGKKRGRKASPQARGKALAPRKAVAPAKARDTDLKRQLAESRAQQAATAEILKVIARSPSDVRPVFDAIAASARRLLDARAALVARRAGDKLELAAFTPTNEAADTALRALFPSPITGKGHMGKAVLDAAPVLISDIENDKSYSEAFRASARVRGVRSVVSVPLLREGEPIGVISVNRPFAGEFSKHQTNLLRTFADQAVIAIENVRLFNETRDSLERQTATSEILASISGSMTDARPVFDAIVRNINRLFGTRIAVLQLRREELVEMPAADGDPGFVRIRERYPRPLDDTTVGGLAMLSKQTVRYAPVIGNPEAPPATVQFAKDFGFNSVLFTPMIHEGKVIGAIGTGRQEPEPFDERQVELIKTFAAQAVIAIENVRLFNETKEALERQTATAGILRVISGSPASVQPVFDSILQHATRLCEAQLGFVFTSDGKAYDLVAQHGLEAESYAAWRAAFAEHRIPGPLSGLGRLLRGESSVHIADVADEEAYRARDPLRVLTVELIGARTFLAVPLVKETAVIGAVVMYRREVRPFADKQIALLQTFADQAVIAIENVRLFNETKEALERQTATAEILKVIASSLSDVQPVFDAIVQSGLRLFAGAEVAIGIVHGGELRAEAAAGTGKVPVGISVPISRESAGGTAILERRLVNIRDTEAPEAPQHARENGRRLGIRSMTHAPMFREGVAIGTILVMRSEPGGLDESQLALLKTFADQAVIAIENVRLFKELQSRTEALTRSVGQLTALGEVGQAISSTLDLETVLKTIVVHAVQLTGLDAGVIYEFDEATEQFQLRASEKFDEDSVASLRGAAIRRGEGAIGRSVETRAPTQVPDTHASDYPARLRELLDRQGFRAILAVPLLREDHIIGALMVIRKAAGTFAPEVVELLKTFATQSAMAIQNARLFREIAEKGKQLEVASRHKSDFLSSMSHELRTPLNAILGFNEMILGQVYGEVPADMQEPLKDIQTSGKHLLRLINNVLDLAKIEAGRMELSLSDYSVHDTVASVHSTLRPLAAEKGLEFFATVPNDVPLAYGDGGRMTQCLMNLAGNSLKFTKAGKVEIAVEVRGELLVYKVSDTGIGIPPDKIGSLFTEFKQTDATIASEYGGTGLGLSISRKFVEMHGGRIRVESELGKGSAFIIEMPLRVKTI